MTFPLLSDDGGLVSETFGVRHFVGYPIRQTFFIDGQGIVKKIIKDHNKTFNVEEMIALAKSSQKL